MKSHVLRTRLIGALCLCACALFWGGCATLGGKSPEVQIVDVITAWKAAFEAQDIDEIMSAYSDDYRTPRMGGKEEMREFLGRMFERGALDELAIDTSQMAVQVEGESGQAGPISFDGSRGQWTFTFIMNKEGKQWLIAGRVRD